MGWLHPCASTAARTSLIFHLQPCPEQHAEGAEGRSNFWTVLKDRCQGRASRETRENIRGAESTAESSRHSGTESVLPSWQRKVERQNNVLSDTKIRLITTKQLLVGPSFILFMKHKLFSGFRLWSGPGKSVSSCSVSHSGLTQMARNHILSPLSLQVLSLPDTDQVDAIPRRIQVHCSSVFHFEIIDVFTNTFSVTAWIISTYFST